MAPEVIVCDENPDATYDNKVMSFMQLIVYIGLRIGHWWILCCNCLKQPLYICVLPVLPRLDLQSNFVEFTTYKECIYSSVKFLWPCIAEKYKHKIDVVCFRVICGHLVFPQLKWPKGNHVSENTNYEKDCIVSTIFIAVFFYFSRNYNYQ